MAWGDGWRDAVDAAGDVRWVGCCVSSLGQRTFRPQELVSRLLRARTRSVGCSSEPVKGMRDSPTWEIARLAPAMVMNWVRQVGLSAGRRGQVAALVTGPKKIVGNGPMGCFEMAPFRNGTAAIARAIAANTECTSIIGGGDTVSAINKCGLAGKMTHVSTGGGAGLA